MPTVKLMLGKYVTLRGPRADGTFRVFFQVPERLRPLDWPSLIPLPFTGSRAGDLQDGDEVARIQGDAKTLYERLTNARLGRPAVAERRDMPTLIRKWQDTQRFKDKKPATQKGYAYHAGLLRDWSASVNHPLIAGMTKDRIEAFLSLYDDRPTTRRYLKAVLHMLLEEAVGLDWIAKNPAATIKVSAPKTKVAIWEPDDVEFYMWACCMAGQPSIAALILTEWEIGQRITDARRFRHGAEWKDNLGAFQFDQSKTDNPVAIPVSDRLRQIIKLVRREGSLYLFTDATTGKPWAEQRLGHVFDDIRVASGGPHLQLRALRHSCVVQLARAGCEVPEIAAITGHSLHSATQILNKYLPRDDKVARAAQAKRGIVRPA